ncbi:hypothetical protein J4H86_06485 [Spiractinospora alimapuensis]|nr:hypothetical protein [Spiractinospora alimapuensis]QVQ53401.1 hypothetical protein J4H86_06485 [Spiractinospora alimapuensis]
MLQPRLSQLNQETVPERDWETSSRNRQGSGAPVQLSIVRSVTCSRRPSVRLRR